MCRTEVTFQTAHHAMAAAAAVQEVKPTNDCRRPYPAVYSRVGSISAGGSLNKQTVNAAAASAGPSESLAVTVINFNNLN